MARRTSVPDPKPATDPVLRAWSDVRMRDVYAQPRRALGQLRTILDPNLPGRPTVRKNEAALTNAERQAYIAAIEGLRRTRDAEGLDLYSKLVQVHGIMAYNMHGDEEPGRSRFLPWHRVYLRVFERLLQAVDPTVAIPYWEWSRNRTVPPWLLSYLPLVTVGLLGYQAPHQVVRGASVVPTPAREEVWRTLHGPAEYVPFTDALEGHHNLVHVWVGGSMALVPIAPADPVFWLHHAEVDRLWHIWQAAHPGKKPALQGEDRVMAPWTSTYDDVHDLAAMGYAYAETTFERGDDWPAGQQLPSPAHLLSAALGSHAAATVRPRARSPPA